jgi:hypothetical protein
MQTLMYHDFTGGWVISDQVRKRLHSQLLLYGWVSAPGGVDDAERS